MLFFNFRLAKESSKRLNDRNRDGYRHPKTRMPIAARNPFGYRGNRAMSRRKNFLSTRGLTSSSYRRSPSPRHRDR